MTRDEVTATVTLGSGGATGVETDAERAWEHFNCLLGRRNAPTPCDPVWEPDISDRVAKLGGT